MNACLEIARTSGDDCLQQWHLVATAHLLASPGNF